MKNIYDLYTLIEKEKIILEEFSFSSLSCIDGIYLNTSTINPTIGINNRIVPEYRKYFSILAEELGHYFTSLGNLTTECLSYTQKLNKTTQEYRARMWAANYLISNDDILGAILNNISTLYDLAIHFNVKQWLVQYKLLSIFHDKAEYTRIKKLIMMEEVAYENCCV